MPAPISFPVPARRPSAAVHLPMRAGAVHRVSTVTPTAPESPQPPPRGGRWLTRRMLLAGLAILVLAGGATAVFALDEVSSVVEALGESKSVKIAPSLLATAARGEPQTLLLVGNDQRPAPKNNPNGFVIPHSNEMLLVRIDPSKPTISMLSIPRELQVTIYPHGAPAVTTRINAAYGIGGAQLMTETIKRVLGVSINHVFVLTFPKFRRAVDEMGCVYTTVDRRYYHVNEPGGEQYFEINLQPGYQRLCGKESLEFVANRHEDTSLVRDARDQRFLLETKAQYGPSLFENRDKFERILGRTVETDLHGSSQVLSLLELLLQSVGKPVRQVHFNVNLGPSVDTASEAQIHEAVESFLRGTAAVHRRSVAPPPSPTHHVTHVSTPGLVPTTATELQAALVHAPEIPFPVEYPRRRDAGAGAGPDLFRFYYVRGQDGRVHPIYVIAIDRGQLGEHYDVQGTTWTDPPLLANPEETVTVGSRTYELFYSAEALRVIAWRENGATYWIQNTLTNGLSPQTMLAIAEQTNSIVSAAPAAAPAAAAHAVVLAPHTKGQAGTAEKLGALLGLAALLGVAVVSFPLLRRRRELGSLRSEMAHAMTMAAASPAGIDAAVAAALGRPIAAGVPGAARPAASPAPPPVTHRAPRRLAARPAAVLGVIVALIAGVLIVVLMHGTGSGGPAVKARTVAVSVYSATPSQNAREAATRLRAAHVHVGAIGNIDASLGHGAFVLYPSGTKAEAERVASLLPGGTAEVQPIQPQLQDLTGRHNDIFVVLD